MTLYYRTILVTLCILKFINSSKAADNVRIFTVATEANDGYERYIRSAKYYGLQVQTLGMGKEWQGGDMRGHGGGFKVNLLKEAVEPYKDDENTIIIFTDSYDVVFTSNLDDILSKFRKFGAKILFGAEHYCWPDESLKSMYPTVTAKSARFLNSGLFMGYASSIYDLLKTPISDADDDQLYYTQAYLDNDLRNNLGIQLDHKSEIFQNLHGARADVKLDVDTSTGQGSLQNLNFMTHPSVVHGNGLSKIYLNAFSNYLAGNFEDQKCKLCEDTKLEIDENKIPIVSLSLFVIKPMPFFEEFLDRILELKYPRKSINLFLYCNVPYHEELVKKFISNHGDDYKTIKTVLSSQKIEEAEARGLSTQQAQQKKSDYLFSVDAEAHLDNPEVLRDLIKFNKSFIAPVLVRPSEMWSNFWGALSESGYYARSHDYVDIVKNNIRGMWNMPYVSTVYLAKSSILEKFNFNHETYDPDMVLCAHLRDKGVFMYVVNMEYYGHLVNNDDFNPSNTRPDFYMLFSNPSDWQRRYIHPEYIELLKPNVTFKQPCTDVYWLPIATERFCKDLIAIMEAFGKWSDGSNNDKRLEGGYEAVPTRDIHMNQVGLDAMWLHFLKLYVRPLQETIYTGYYHNPPRSLMNFVVRYRIDEQPYLRPHHDSSTYTINIALNRAGIDYEGGGCRFIRYNCSVTDTKMGWMLMHPGRLTHFHEGLKTLSGTRYIMISFVDP